MGGAPALSLNVLPDATGSIRLRPAIVEWPDFPAPATASIVDAIETFGQYIVFVTRDRAVHAWLGPGNVVTLSDATAASKLDSDQRPVMCETRTRMIIAGGGALQKWDGITPLSQRLGGSPPPATHVVALADGLVVNPRGVTGQVQWSEAGETTGHETWPASNFHTLESAADPCVALGASLGEALGFGTRTLEMLAPTVVSVGSNQVAFDLAPVRELPNGIGAPYSLIHFEDNFAFLDDLKRLVALNGRASAVGPDATGIISSPAMTKVIKEELGTVDDAWGFRLNQGAWDCLVWVFPTAGRTFVYNLDAKAWSEWSSWGASGRLSLGITAYHYSRFLGLHLVGDATGRINVLDLNAHQDDAGPIVADMITGFLDRGTLSRKWCRQISLTFRRGAGTLAGPAPRAFLSWRSNTGAFESPLEIDLGTADDVETTVSFQSLGTYFTRQWRLTFSENAPFTLVRAQEDVDVLEV